MPPPEPVAPAPPAHPPRAAGLEGGGAAPAAIDVDRTTAVHITWDDGHASTYPLGDLRLACPCAGCKAEWSAGRRPRLPEPLAITDVVLAGAWGMTPTWNDGHATGIYSWAYLREGCPCPDCGSR